MSVVLLSLLMCFLTLFAVFGLVLGRLRADDEDAHPLVALLTVAFSASSILLLLLAPVAVLLVVLLAVEHLSAEAVRYETYGGLFAAVLAVAIGLFLYELLVEGYVSGLFKHFGLPGLGVKILEGLLTGLLVLVIPGTLVQSVDVSWPGALAVGAVSACASRIIEKLL